MNVGNKLFFFFIKVPPDRISIRDEAGVDRASVVGPYSEGDTVSLKCDVYGGLYNSHTFIRIIKRVFHIKKKYKMLCTSHSIALHNHYV